MLIKAFNDIRRIPLPEKEGIAGYDDLRTIAALQVGTGNRAFKADQSGIWLGANKFANAPFRVAMDGTVVVGSGYTKINIFKQDGIPTSISTGDLWFDTNDKNKLYRAGSAGADEIAGGEWEAVRDTDIAQAISDAADAATDAATAIADAAEAKGIADGKVTTFYQAEAPTAEGTGDLWLDTDDDRLYRWSGSAWVEIQDTDIAQAISDASDAQNTADGKIVTFAQDAAPTAEGTGDFWIDTNDGNKIYRWSGSAWVAVDDTRKITVFAQDAIPTSLAVGDLWFDTNDDNKPYIAESVGADEITGGEWVLIDDQRAADALLKAGASQTLTGDIIVGASGVTIDGANIRIVIHDGTVPRGVFGDV